MLGLYLSIVLLIRFVNLASISINLEGILSFYLQLKLEDGQIDHMLGFLYASIKLFLTLSKKGIWVVVHEGHVLDTLVHNLAIMHDVHVYHKICINLIPMVA